MTSTHLSPRTNLYVDHIGQQSRKITRCGEVHPQSRGDGHLFFIPYLNDLAEANSDHPVMSKSFCNDVDERAGGDVLTEREFSGSKVEYRHFYPFKNERTEERGKA